MSLRGLGRLCCVPLLASLCLEAHALEPVKNGPTARAYIQEVFRQNDCSISRDAFGDRLLKDGYDGRSSGMFDPRRAILGNVERYMRRGEIVEGDKRVARLLIGPCAK